MLKVFPLSVWAPEWGNAGEYGKKSWSIGNSLGRGGVCVSAAAYSTGSGPNKLCDSDLETHGINRNKSCVY